MPDLGLSRGFGLGRNRGAGSAPGLFLNALGLSAASVAEDAAPGTVVGSVQGYTPGGTLTLVDDAGGRFALSGTEVVTGATGLDHETATSHQVMLRETLAEATNSPRDTVLTIAVTDVAETAPPTSIGLSADSLPEDAVPGSVVGVLSSDGTAPVTFSLVADPDGRFAVSGSSLELAAALDYETATSHSVTLRATNGAGSVDQVFTITVTDVAETLLSALSLSGAGIAEDALPGTLVGDLSGITAGSVLSLSDDAGGRFALVGTQIVTGLTALDYETATSHGITVRETAPGVVNSPRDTVLIIDVTDVSEAVPPTASTAPAWSNASPAPGDTVTITEGTYSGTAPITIAGTLTLDGGDVTGDMVGNTYTIPGGTADAVALVWSEVASNVGGSATAQTATATVTVAAGDAFITEDFAANQIITRETASLLTAGSGDYAATNLPLGLSIDASTGVISGRVLGIRSRQTVTVTRGAASIGRTIGVTARNSTKVPKQDGFWHLDVAAVETAGAWDYIETVTLGASATASVAALNAAIGNCVSNGGALCKIVYQGHHLDDATLASLPTNYGSGHTPVAGQTIVIDCDHASGDRTRMSILGSAHNLVWKHLELHGCGKAGSYALPVTDSYLSYYTSNDNLSGGGLVDCRLGPWWRGFIDSFRSPKLSGPRVRDNAFFMEGCEIAGVYRGSKLEGGWLGLIDVQMHHSNEDIFLAGGPADSGVTGGTDDAEVYQVRNITHSFLRHDGPRDGLAEPQHVDGLGQWGTPAANDGTYDYTADRNITLCGTAYYGGTGVRAQSIGDGIYREIDMGENLLLSTGVNGYVSAFPEGQIDGMMLLPYPAFSSFSQEIAQSTGTVTIARAMYTNIKSGAGWATPTPSETNSAIDLTTDLSATLPGFTGSVGLLSFVGNQSGGAPYTRFIPDAIEHTNHPAGIRAAMSAIAHVGADWGQPNQIISDPAGWTGWDWGSIPADDAPTLSLVVDEGAGTADAVVGAGGVLYWMLTTDTDDTLNFEHVRMATLADMTSNTEWQGESASVVDNATVRLLAGATVDLGIDFGSLTPGTTYRLLAVAESDNGYYSAVVEDIFVAPSSLSYDDSLPDWHTDFRSPPNTTFTPDGSDYWDTGGKITRFDTNDFGATLPVGTYTWSMKVKLSSPPSNLDISFEFSAVAASSRTLFNGHLATPFFSSTGGGVSNVAFETIAADEYLLYGNIEIIADARLLWDTNNGSTVSGYELSKISLFAGDVRADVSALEGL